MQWMRPRGAAISGSRSLSPHDAMALMQRIGAAVVAPGERPRQAHAPKPLARPTERADLPTQLRRTRDLEI